MQGSVSQRLCRYYYFLVGIIRDGTEESDEVVNRDVYYNDPWDTERTSGAESGGGGRGTR